MGRPVYQLHAVGEYRYFEGAGTVVSREVYTSRERAEAAIEEFERRCCGRADKKGWAKDLASGSMVVVVKELELIE